MSACPDASSATVSANTVVLAKHKGARHTDAKIDFFIMLVLPVRALRHGTRPVRCTRHQSARVSEKWSDRFQTGDRCRFAGPSRYPPDWVHRQIGRASGREGGCGV